MDSGLSQRDRDLVRMTQASSRKTEALIQKTQDLVRATQDSTINL